MPLPAATWLKRKSQCAPFWGEKKRHSPSENASLQLDTHTVPYDITIAYNKGMSRGQTINNLKIFSDELLFHIRNLGIDLAAPQFYLFEPLAVIPGLGLIGICPGIGQCARLGITL